MAKPKHIILTEDGVITQEALLAYAGGKLSAEETVQLEKLLKDDPFAQDALEGMRSTAAPVEMKTVITSLNTQLREKTGAREKKTKGIEIHWATYAYAAMIVGILIGLGFVMIHFISNKEQQIAMNKAAPQAEESAPLHEEKPPVINPVDTAHTTAPVTTDAGSTTDSLTLSTNASSAGTYMDADKANKGSATFVNPASPAPDKKPLISPLKAEPSKNGLNNAGRADEKQLYYSQDVSKNNAEQRAKTSDNKSSFNDATYTDKGSMVADREEGNSKDGFIIDKVVPSEALAKEKKEKNRKADALSVTPTDNVKAARVLFDAADYKAASKKYNEVLSAQPDNADALYFGGISDYFIGKGKQAEKNFDKLLKANLYVDGSKWYKANVLVDKGKKDEAKQLLRDLINTNSSFKDRAVKKYEDIVK